MKIICDIDGTIADISHRLHYLDKKGIDEPVDWDSFFADAKDDVPITWMVEIIKSLHDSGVDVVFITGRNKSIRKITERWLEGVFFGVEFQLYMRASKDYRQDYGVKADILKQAELTPENVLCVFDDRTQVVDMYRERGFNVLQCAKGDF